MSQNRDLVELRIGDTIHSLPKSVVDNIKTVISPWGLGVPVEKPVVLAPPITKDVPAKKSNKITGAFKSKKSGK